MSELYEVRPQKAHGEPTGKHELLENGSVVAVCFSKVDASFLTSMLNKITPAQRHQSLCELEGRSAA